MARAERWARQDRPALRRFVVVLLALVGAGAVVGGGSLIPSQSITSVSAPAPLVGRTTSVCTVAPPPADQPADQPLATTSVTAVTNRPGEQPQTPAPGQLVGTPIDSAEESLRVDQQGKGTQLSGVKASVLLESEGALATASTGAVFSSATSGPEAGLSAAPCLAPATQQWFSGIGSGDADISALILSNPDDAQAEVDLRFYGRAGRVAVAGSPAVVVEAHTSRTVALSGLDTEQGPFSVEVHASDGRVAAAVRRSRTADLAPAGVDWQLPAAAPSLTSVVPAVPGGDGGRQLVVTNPGVQRATVQVDVLGLQGAFPPSGADSLEVPGESTAAVDLGPGLAGEAASVLLTSDQPVTGAVVSSSRRTDASTDLAVQSAAPALQRLGVTALATTSTADSELVLSNSADTDVQVSFEVLSLDGVTLRTDDVLLAAQSTATRRLTSTPPSYLVVRVPDGSSVVGGVVLTQDDGVAAGLATVPLTSPDLSGRAPTAEPDPNAGR